MVRTACVDIAALPLQVLLRDHPDWADQPVVVVDRDKPSGRILWVNEAARSRRILPGLRYAAGLALADALRGGVVDGARIAAETGGITQRLWQFTPHVEPAAQEPGVFWLDATGMQRLYPQLAPWAQAIGKALEEAGFTAAVAVGFSRFGSYAAAKTGHPCLVFESPGDERAYVRKVPIERLAVDPALRQTLRKLGITTLGAFIDLPAAGLRKRFGPAAHALHRMALGMDWTPLQPQGYTEPAERTVPFDFPEADRSRLLARIEPLLDEVLAVLMARHEALAALVLHLVFDQGEPLEEHIAPAAPTVERGPLLDLIGLRLESLVLPTGVSALSLRGEGVAAAEKQLTLVPDAPRELEAIHRAFARLRAELGNSAVVRARLQEGHLPEARFTWEPLDTLPRPQPRDGVWRPLVRRFFSPPVKLPPRPRHEPDGWLVAGCAEGPVEEVIGPHIVSGGWWRREVSRAYYYVRTRSGRWFWIYHDQKRRHWYLQGEVE